ncbi:cyclin-domain-containing protein [Cladochytrium replicatum]|nr:cyclin-domain-containing protein [Cladochytrium replicatum]
MPPQLRELPHFFHQCDTPDVVAMVVEMINKLIAHNDSIRVTHNNLTRFHSRAAPSITLYDYISRIVKYASIEKSVLIFLLIYIDRACERHRHFTISSLTVHRFIISAVTAGSKAVSDIYCTNTHFAKVGGVSVLELNLLEVELCAMLEWHLAVSADVIQQYYSNLVRISSGYSTAAPPDSVGGSGGVPLSVVVVGTAGGGEEPGSMSYIPYARSGS